MQICSRSVGQKIVCRPQTTGDQVLQAGLQHLACIGAEIAATYQRQPLIAPLKHL